MTLAADAGVDVWIGATDLRMEGEWEWHDDGSDASKNMPHNYWAKHEPIPYGWTVDCAVISHVDGLWRTVKCDEPYHVVCEGGAPTPRPPPSHTT